MTDENAPRRRYATVEEGTATADMADIAPTAEIDALAAALQRHDPEPYYPGNYDDRRYYREYAAAIIASGLRVIPPGEGEA